MRLIIQQDDELREMSGMLDLQFDSFNCEPILSLYPKINLRENVSILSFLRENKDKIIEKIKQEININNFNISNYEENRESFQKENEKLKEELSKIDENINVDSIVIRIDTLEQLENVDCLFQNYNDSYPQIYIDLGSLNYEDIVYCLSKIKEKLDKISSDLDSKLLYFGNYNYTAENNRVLETASNREDTLFTLNAVLKIKQTIQHYNISPYEAYMLVYDFVRDRIYKTSDNANYMESRDINQILKGDKIVCAGYANLMNTILNSLGIQSKVILLKHKEINVGHARIMSVIKDEKYDINNIVISDPTADRKMCENNNEFLYRYFNFARPKRFYTGDMYIFRDFTLFDIETLKKVEACELSMEDRYNILIQIKKVYRFLNMEDECIFIAKKDNFYEVNRLIRDDEVFKKEYKKAYKLLNKSIPHSCFVQCLYRIRRIQHTIDPIKYPFSLEVIETIDKNSSQFFKEDLLLERIFGTRVIDMIESSVEMRDIEEDEKVEKDIGRIKVLSRLKQIRKL